MRRIYLDNHATTALDPRVRQAIEPLLDGVYGNPSSVHGEGRKARQAVDRARRQVAKAIGCRERELVFTSGGTEANNLAIRGGYLLGSAAGQRRVISSSVEHPSVLEALKALPGAELVLLPVDGQGQLDLKDLEQALAQPTALVSLMAANNETGQRFEVESAAALCRSHGALFHSDAVQALGKGGVPQAPDLLSLSAHKIHGPKGVGALRVRQGLELPRLLLGGHQERGRRGGTENSLGIVGFGAAASLLKDAEAELERMKALRDRLEAGILAQSPGARVNGGADRLPSVSNICFPGLDGEALVIAMDMEGISLSSGSACSSGTMAPSPVLLAMGLSYEDAGSSLRFSLSRQTTAAEIDVLLTRFPVVLERLRALEL